MKLLNYGISFIFNTEIPHRGDYKACIEKELSKRISDESGKYIVFKYEKNNKEMYKLLQKYGDEKQATKWAKNLVSLYTDSNFSSHNPCTKVFKLIEKLNEIRDSENKTLRTNSYAIMLPKYSH